MPCGLRVRACVSVRVYLCVRARVCRLGRGPGLDPAGPHPGPARAVSIRARPARGCADPVGSFRVAVRVDGGQVGCLVGRPSLCARARPSAHLPCLFVRASVRPSASQCLALPVFLAACLSLCLSLSLCPCLSACLPGSSFEPVSVSPGGSVGVAQIHGRRLSVCQQAGRQAGRRAGGQGERQSRTMRGASAMPTDPLGGSAGVFQTHGRRLSVCQQAGRRAERDDEMRIRGPAGRDGRAGRGAGTVSLPA